MIVLRCGFSLKKLQSGKNYEPPDDTQADRQLYFHAKKQDNEPDIFIQLFLFLCNVMLA